MKGNHKRQVIKNIELQKTEKNRILKQQQFQSKQKL